MAENTIEYAFEHQAQACDKMDSPMTAFLTRAMLADFEGGGVTARLLADWQGDPVDAALGIRLAAALHYAVLTDRAPDLAAYYPNLGGRFDESCAPAVLTTMEANFDLFREFISHPPQTNEVRRSGVLLGGFLTVARETGLPLRCLEVAASAGLNLHWDKFQYRVGDARWGDPASPVAIESDWSGPAINLDVVATVAAREGCDLKPVDLSDPDAGIHMEAFVWPDQTARFDAMAAAIEMMRKHPVTLAKADASDWVTAKLRDLPTNMATVVYHSIATHYFTDQSRNAMIGSIAEAGRRATPEAPLAWLRMEFPDPGQITIPELRLTLWPGGEDRLLALVHPHGNFARWQD